MKFNRNITVEDKFENVYKFVQKELNEEIPMPVFHEILGKLDKWQDKKRREKMQITPLQARVYETLAKHEYKPSTLYKYALFLKSAPPNLLKKMREKASMRKLIKERKGKVEFTHHEKIIKSMMLDKIERYLVR